MAKKKPSRRKSPVSVVAAFEDKWKRRRGNPEWGSGNWLVSPPRIVDPAELVKTLRLLRYLTHDARYRDLEKYLVTDLVDRKTGRWVGYRPFHPDKEMACAVVEEAMANGMSEREAIARFVVEFNIDAKTFMAARMRVKRLLTEYRKRERR
jgi:hypothetical protein